MADKLNEDRIQSLANVLSLVAIVGRMDNTTIQRVLVSLGSSLMDVPAGVTVDRQVTRKLLDNITKEKGEEAAAHFASDMLFVADAWQPVLTAFKPEDPYRLMPFAEIIFSLVNYSGVALQNHDAFTHFGGPDDVLPMRQLTAALQNHPAPKPNLRWEFVGFEAPSDQALVGSSTAALYLFKSAPSGIDMRFSQLARSETESSRREIDVRVDTPLFAAFTAGLLADMLYWVARMRTHALPGQELWQRINTLILPDSQDNG
ncbi:MAG: hypothetical protein ACFB51_22075 [Anaerolineae bacterium]